MGGAFRSYLAESIPPAFARLQGAGVIPSPWDEGRHIRLGEAGRGYEERITGDYKPKASLAPYVVAADDATSANYIERFEDCDRSTAAPVKFGTLIVPRVKIWPKFGVHSSAAGSFADVYCNLAALANPKYEVPRLALRLLTARKRFQDAIFLGIAWWHNHYHWMIDILPRLDLVRPELEQGLPVIAPPDLGVPQRTALRAVLDGMGYHQTEIIQPQHRVCLIDRLVMPTQMAHPLDMSPKQVGLLRDAFLKDDASPGLPKRLYISRADAAIRRIKNEDELLSVLEPLGFVSVQLAKLTLGEQVSLFRQAECIIGHHGAGFTNVAFCSPATVFIEIFQNGHFAGCFARLAQLSSLRYGYCVGTAEGADTNVSLPAVMSLCRRFGID